MDKYYTKLQNAIRYGHLTTGNTKGTLVSTRTASTPVTAPGYGIAVVARRTGLSQLVLRAWERRYRAVVPGRTGTGRRRYCDVDIERLILLHALTAADHRIGDIAHLSAAELRALAAELAPEPAPGPGPVATPPAVPAGPAGADTADMLLAEALAATAALDPGALEEALARAALQLRGPALRQELILPLLQRVGELWRDGSLRIAHEHMTSAVVRAFLAEANTRRAPAPGAPCLVVATPVLNHHELGAMLAASLGREQGWDVLYLGADLPAEEIAAAAVQRRAPAVFLSLIHPVGDPVVSMQIDLLRRLVGPGTVILAGGGAAASYDAMLERVRARRVDTPEGFAGALAAVYK